MNFAKTLTRNSYVLFQNEKICQMLNSASQQFFQPGKFIFKVGSVIVADS